MTRKRFLGMIGLVTGLGATITGCKRDSAIEGWERSSVEGEWGKLSPSSPPVNVSEAMERFEEYCRKEQQRHIDDYLKGMKFGKSWYPVQFNG